MCYDASRINVIHLGQALNYGRVLAEILTHIVLDGLNRAERVVKEVKYEIGWIRILPQTRIELETQFGAQ